MAEDPGFPLARADAVRRVLPLLADPPRVATGRPAGVMRLTTGLAASPGVASGPIATDPAAALACADAGTPAILVRAETSPDDVHGLARAAGILTSRGGLASHAAVVARGWGIPAVVGAERVEVGDGEVQIDGRALRGGDVITIDGGTGEVFEGAVAGSTEVAPEAVTLVGWAREAGIDIKGGDDAAPSGGTAPSTAGAIDPDRVLQAIAIKGFALPEAIADTVLATPDAVGPIIDRLIAERLVELTAGAYKLTDAGRVRSDELIAAERDAWGIDAASAALDAFLDIDHRVKETVTAWQLRNGTPNDHTDAGYDSDVLVGLAAIHADATAWLAPLVAGCPRLGDYGTRLGRAIEAARGGDGRFVASPRVDSYHGIWFELHEDLIQLAGRTREDEAAAGRA
jgi:pyruvate,orthophosphate dikinase